jgi:hypothetical protein
VEHLKKTSKKVSSKDEIEQVASISANDPKIGKLIAEAMEKVGNDGVITVEEAQEITVENVMIEVGGAKYSVPAEMAAELAKMLADKGLKPEMADMAKPAQEEMAAVKADAQRKIDSLQARLDGLQSAASAKALRESIAQEVRADIAVTELAVRFDAALAASDTLEDKRRKVVAKIDPSVKIDGKSPEYVAGLLDALVLARGEHAAASPRAGSVRLDANESDDPAAAARAKMIAHLEGRA